MENLLWVLLLVMVFQTLFVLWNLPQMRRLSQFSICDAKAERGHPSNAGQTQADGNPGWSSGAAEQAIRLSILIPARNEEENIGPCLESVLANEFPFREILILNDRSSDGTSTRIAMLADRDSRIREIQGEELPPGWMGKSHACHQLSLQAQGEWWLFLDADARLSPDALAKVACAAAEQQRGLLTGFPRQITGTWLEKLVVPMMLFTIACHLPIRLVRHTTDPRFVAAHGGFMLIESGTYSRLGGHAAFKDNLVDDISLARAVKRIGEPVELLHIGEEVEMRMYKDAAEVWNGYKKNIYAGVGRSFTLLTFVLSLYFLLYVLPWLTLPWAVFHPELWLPAASLCTLGVLLKARINHWCGQPIWRALLMPLCAAALIAIGLESWRAAAFGSGYRWKGRTYH
ncbi:glycosyltransferase [Paenibacillus pinihumi]|uniref:glycosyltransferase n=1 Tax=Paenibacillus pinihumi TaxID=669462 RepID=UPI00048DD995|nr:glycosyltransferase [Paenibacillus pinihumi]